MNPTKSDQLPQMPLGQLTRASLTIRFTVVAIVIAGLAVLFAYPGGWLTPHALTPASMINTFQKVNGLHQSRDITIDSTATATSTLAPVARILPQSIACSQAHARQLEDLGKALSRRRVPY